MKNVKMYWGILMACLAVSACNNDEEEITEEAVSVPFNIQAAYPVKDDAYPQTGWKAGDRLAVLRTDEKTYDKILLSWSSGEMFTGVLDDDTDTDATFSFLYPADVYAANTNDTLTQVLSLNGQDGTLEGVSAFDYMWGSGTVVAESASFSIASEMKALTGICKFQFVGDNGNPIEDITQVILTSPSDTLYQCATLDMKEGTLSDFTKGSIKVVNEAGVDNVLYVALFPSKKPLHFTITTADGKAYEAATSTNVPVEQGGYLVLDPIVCSSLPLARTGDYFYNDATWSTERNPGKTCVGIVYALEDETGTIAKNLISSAHGRVVALEDCQEGITWSLSLSDIEDIDNYEVLCDTLTFGSLPYFEGTADSFFEGETIHQLDGVGIDETTGSITRWYSSGALEHFDGELYSSFIKNNLSYPAAAYSYKYGKCLTGWYLPSVGELALLWVIQKSGMIQEDKQEGYNNLARFGYWSSSEAAENKAWYINFYSGMIASNSKQSNYNVRPVIRF